MLTKKQFLAYVAAKSRLDPEIDNLLEKLINAYNKAELLSRGYKTHYDKSYSEVDYSVDGDNITITWEENYRGDTGYYQMTYPIDLLFEEYPFESIYALLLDEKTKKEEEKRLQEQARKAKEKAARHELYKELKAEFERE